MLFLYIWGYSSVVERGLRMAETRVRFPLTPPKFIYSVICLARGFAPRFGGHFGKIIPRIFKINRQFSRRKAAVHKLLSLYCGKAAMSRWFSFAFGEIQNEILQIVGVKRCLFIKLKTSKNYD